MGNSLRTFFGAGVSGPYSLNYYKSKKLLVEPPANDERPRKTIINIKTS